MVMVSSLNVRAELTSFVPAGGSCMSQGSWTQKALEQTDVIARTLDAMRADPNCKAIVQAIGKGTMFGTPRDFEAAEETYQAETVMQELATLRDVLIQRRNSEIAEKINPALAEATVDAMSAIAEDNASSARSKDIRTMKARLRNSGNQSIRILSTLFQTLPEHHKCMEERSDLSAALVTGGIQVASAFAMGDLGMSTQVAELLSSFLNYAREMKFSSIEKALSQQKLWSELSCLTESAQASYCAVQDGFGLLKIQRDFLNKSFSNSPLEGFYLMSREVPTISNWITKIKDSIEENRRKASREFGDNQMTGTDDVNLSDEAVAGTTESVRASLENVKAYLIRLYNRLESRRDSQPILLSLVDTISRIDRVLGKFTELDREAKDLGILLKKGTFRINDLSEYTEEQRLAHKQKFADLVAAAYNEFNVQTQDDTFFSGRLATYVRHEYDVRLKYEDFSKYTNQLLVSARGSVMEKLKEYQKFNIAEAHADLSQASNIHMANLDALEKLTAKYYEDYLIYLNKRAGHSFRCSSRNKVSWNPLRLSPLLTGDCTLIESKQDLNNEAETLRAKVCIQTLGFQNYKDFMGLCQGAVLKSSNGKKLKNANGLQLEFNYDQLFRKRRSEEPWTTAWLGTSAPNRFSQVCLLRDYFRNNFVHWLTLRHESRKQ